MQRVILFTNDNAHSVYKTENSFVADFTLFRILAKVVLGGLLAFLFELIAPIKV